MATTLTLNAVSGISGRIIFNKQNVSGEVTTYYPILIIFNVTATGDGVSKNFSDSIIVGGEQPDAHTPQELYTLMVNAFGQAAANKIKALYLSALNEDISS